MKSSRNRSWAGNFGFSYTNCIDTLSINSMLEDYDFSVYCLQKIEMCNTKNQFCHLENKSSLILREKVC